MSDLISLNCRLKSCLTILNGFIIIIIIIIVIQRWATTSFSLSMLYSTHLSDLHYASVVVIIVDANFGPTIVSILSSDFPHSNITIIDHVFCAYLGTIEEYQCTSKITRSCFFSASSLVLFLSYDEDRMMI